MKNNDIQESADKELMEAWKAPFPAEFIDAEVMQLVPDLLCTHTPDSLKTSWTVFKRLLQGETELNMREMGVAINVVTATPKSETTIYESGVKIPIDIDTYIRIQDAAFGMATKWNEIMNATRKRIEGKHQVMAKLMS